MIKFTVGIAIAVLVFWISGIANNNYTIEEYQPALIGKTFTVNKPIAYVKGLDHCNELPEPNAYNTACLLHPQVMLGITELTNSCVGCLNPEDIRRPRTLLYKEQSTFQVVGAYTYQPNFFVDRLFGWTGSSILVTDSLGNLLEISEIFLKLLVEKPSLSSEERYLKYLHDSRNVNNEINEVMCFFPTKYREYTAKIQQIETMIVLLNLEGKITVTEYEFCDSQHYSGGISVQSNDFDSFLTLQYYLHAGGVFDKWRR